MDNPAVQQYARALKPLLRGRKQKRSVLKEFYSTVALVLDDHPEADYETLVTAIGSPEAFAAALQEDHPYHPMSLKMKLCLALIAVCLVGVSFGLFYIITAESPEIATVYTNPKEFSHENIPDIPIILTDDFNPKDSTCDHPEECSSYILEAHNENTVFAQVLVRYRDDIDPHIFLIPPGETYVLVVNNALPGEHTISFDAEDHTYVGYVEVYVSETPLP